MSTRKLYRVLTAMVPVVLFGIITGCGSSTTGPSSASATATSSPSSEALPSRTARQVPKVGSYEGIDVGECFDFPTVSAAVERSCDEPHDAEMFVTDASVGLNATDAPYPTRQQWQEFSATLCYQPFADYTGQTIEETTELSMSLLFPPEADWDTISRRTLSCAIVSIDDAPLTGSKRA